MHFSSIVRWVAASLLLGTLTGCTPEAVPKISREEGVKRTAEGVQNYGDTKTPPAEQRPQAGVAETREPRYTVRSPRLYSDQSNDKATLNQRADQIAEMVTRIPGIERAAVLLAGKTALVGVDLAATISGSKIDTIKYSVKEAVERTGNGYNAIVSSDIDTVTRVRELVNGIREGRPVSTAADEIADIVSRLLPEM
jgi:YhcN/YlaJ family sporulation lipoprotein